MSETYVLQKCVQHRATINLILIHCIDTNDNSKISSLMPFSPTASRSGSGNQNACMKVNMAMSGSATEIFMVIMNMPPMCRTGCIKNHRIVETIDNTEKFAQNI